jgi:zinc transport system ATP-binding protein
MTDTPAVLFEHVTVQYEDFLALDNISIAVEKRDFLGIIGPNGGGKTTLLRSILGLIKPRSGSIEILGQPPQKMRSAIGYVPQVARFDRFYPIEVWDVVMMGRLTQSGLFKRYGKTDREHAKEALNLVGLYENRFRQLGKLSGGQIQRAIVARALAGQPEILLLDEQVSIFKRNIVCTICCIC